MDHPPRCCAVEAAEQGRTASPDQQWDVAFRPARRSANQFTTVRLAAVVTDSCVAPGIIFNVTFAPAAHQGAMTFSVTEAETTASFVP